MNRPTFKHFFLSLFFMSLSQNSSGECKLPAHNHEFKYYAAYSSRFNSKAEAIDEATEKLRIQAIRENFGVSYSVYKKALVNDDNSQLNVEHDEESARVFLKNFEIIDQDIEEVNDQYEVCLVARYKTSAIKEELARLESNLGVMVPTKYSKLKMTDNNQNDGTLRVESSPSGAKVFVNGESFGHTPLQLEQVSVGEHSIQVVHKYYAASSKSINVTEGKSEQSFYFQLELQKRPIRISSNLSNTDIWVNGNYVGKAPTKELIFLSTDVLTIKAQDANSFPQTIAVDLKKFDDDEIQLALIEKSIPKKKKEVVPSESDIERNPASSVWRKDLIFSLDISTMTINDELKESSSDEVNLVGISGGGRIVYDDSLILRGSYTYSFYENPGYSDSESERKVITAIKGETYTADLFKKDGGFYYGLTGGQKNYQIKINNHDGEKRATLKESGVFYGLKMGGEISNESALVFIEGGFQKNKLRYFSNTELTISFGFGF